MNTTRKKQTVPIFFAVDDNYAPFLTVALRSLIDNSSRSYNYHINVLIEKLDAKNADVILGMQTDNVTIELVDVSDKLESICSRLHMRDYYTKATYYRFFIPEMFPQYDRGVYLDCDIAISTDIARMYNCALGSNLVAAIPDEIITDIDVFARYSETVLNVPRLEYFNAGILVMNLAEMRRMHIEQVFSDLLSERIYRVAQDQDYLNVICHGRVKYFDKTWNKTPMPENSDPCVIPNIAHYKINFKPWKYDDVIYGDVFWYYAEKTPFYQYLLDMRGNYTDEEKQRDQAQYEGLVELAIEEVREELENKISESFRHPITVGKDASGGSELTFFSELFCDPYCVSDIVAIGEVI